MKIIFDFKLLSLMLSVLLLVACASPKKVIYFQDKEITSLLDTVIDYAVVYGPNDLLAISVSALDIDAIRPFNKVQSEDDKGGGYLVDEKGMVVFPVLGKIKLLGLNRSEAILLIKEKLEVYIKNPVVDVRILNFQVTILGSVSSPGNYTAQGEYLTLIEALGMAGDLSITGMRENILVVRDIEGQKKEFRVNLTSKEIFASPVYYLHPNDVIYVQPNKGGVNASAFQNTQLFRSNVSLVTSLITTVVTIMVLFSIK